MPRDALDDLHAPTRAWFEATFAAPSEAQARAWPAILAGDSTLLLAPTGSGKTLAAFLAAIDSLLFSSVPAPKERCRVLYVSPLKALAVDVERNLRAPLAGVSEAAVRLGVPFRDVEVGVRTGDTSPADRARMKRTPPDILITTPESLFLIATSAAREILMSIDTVIVDEIHALLPTKRGAHLFLTLERLEAMRARARPSARPLQRIGLSATQRNLDEVAQALGGFTSSETLSGSDVAKRRKNGPIVRPRPVTIVDARRPRSITLRVENPVDDMSRVSELAASPIESFAARGAVHGLGRASLWPHIHAQLLDEIERHRSTIIFVNSRRLAERLAGALNELATARAGVAFDRPYVEAHHGSVAREQRALMEDRLKRGDLRAIAATSSLELGIDMGEVDQVVQIEPPPSVSSALQRIGRAKHQVGGVPSGLMIPKHRGDLLACAAIARLAVDGEIEATRSPRNALDVLAQQLVAIVGGDFGLAAEVPIALLFELVRRAAAYRDLPKSAFDGVLDMLGGRYATTEMGDAFADLRPRLVVDRERGVVRARAGALQLAIVNGGTIADRGMYNVTLGTRESARSAEKFPEKKAPSRRIGELDEEMVFESGVGDVFVLGASSWRIEEITRDQVIVSPAPGEPGRMPFWHGDRGGRPVPLGRAIGALTRELGVAISEGKSGEATARLVDDHFFDGKTAANLIAYVTEQLDSGGALPTDRAIVIERTVDEQGDARVCVMTPFGAKVHAPWSMIVGASLRARGFVEVDALWSDDGMVFRVPASDRAPDTATFLVPSEGLDDRVASIVGGTALFAARFREAAGRALLLPRRRPGARTPLWAQRKRAADLLGVASGHADFPIVHEAMRECLCDVFDLDALAEIARAIEQRRIDVVTVDLPKSSPFARGLLFSYVASFMYEGDAPLAEQRAHLLSVDAAQLRELLGESDLRQLLDAESVEAIATRLQRRSPERRARDADGVHDLLRALGDLSREEIADRCAPSLTPTTAIATLLHDRRAIEVTIANKRSLIAIEDAARYRDALGVDVGPRAPSSGHDEAGLALRGLVLRWARTHAAFTDEGLAMRWGVDLATLRALMDALEREGLIASGAITPDTIGVERCDVEVLAKLKQASLTKARRAIEPVEPRALAELMVEWQGIGARSTPRGRSLSARATELVRAIERISGAAIPASILEHEVLPARVAGYEPAVLDALMSAGEIVWAGIEPVGSSPARDGNIALYVADRAPLLARSASTETLAEASLTARVRAHLDARGACFFSEIARAVGGFPGEIVDALWTLVWRGDVSNDTLAPLRELLAMSTSKRSRPHASRNQALTLRNASPPTTAGRWSRWQPDRPTDATTRALAVAESLLDRYGVLAREAARGEIEGGFSTLYPALRALEESGRARRGYFVAGLGGAQFARAGADDRLRALRESEGRRDAIETVTIAACDPANPYGSILAWPRAIDAAAPSTRPSRVSGATVILRAGALLGWLSRVDGRLATFLPVDEAERAIATRALVEAIADRLEGPTPGVLLLTEIDGISAVQSPLAPALERAGFRAHADGLLRRRPPNASPRLVNDDA